MANATRRSSAAARDDVLDAAYELFNQKGIRAIGVDAIIARAGVAKATFYHHGDRSSARIAREAGSLVLEAALKG